MSNNTDTLAAKIMRAKDRGTAGTFSELGRQARESRIDGMCEAWEHLTGEDASEENLAAAAARAEAEAPIFVKDVAANWIGVSDEVRIGNGFALYRIVSIDGDTLHMYDDYAKRHRKAKTIDVRLSIEGDEAVAARAEQGLFNIF